MKHKFRRGQYVRIGRYKTRLQYAIRLGDGAGWAWRIDPPVQGFTLWNREDIKPWSR